MRNLLKNLESRNLLMIEEEKPPVADGGTPLIGDAAAPKGDAHVVPDKYEFGKVKTKDDKGVETEVDLPEATVKQVTEFAKANKMSQAQAKAFLDYQLANPKAVVPEAYTFAKIKEGDKEVDVPKEVSDPVAAFAKENGFTQPQAQKLLDRELQLQNEATANYEKQTADMVKTWREDMRKDPVLSAGNFDANLVTAKKALDTFFPGLAANVQDHMFLDHPTVVLGLYNIGKKISEDPNFISGDKVPENRSAAEVLFGGKK